MKINSIDSLNRRQGFWIYFYPYGRAEVFEVYQGRYLNDRKTGIWRYYNYNGFLSKEEDYVDNGAYVREYDKKNAIIAEGLMTIKEIDSNVVISDPLTGENVEQTMRIEIKSREGWWKFYRPDGKLYLKKMYENNKEKNRK